VFDMTPEVFAEGIALCLENGASVVGGCCGTTPEHIRKISNLT
jgi:5-methyltetrahydrofolate--homocysteine methyltransferase